MTLNTKALKGRIVRARACTSQGTVYKLGAGDLDQLVPHADCTAFVAHCCYLHRDPGESSGKRKGWVESTAIYKDATGKQETWVKLPEFVPGCVIVYPDRAGKEGHAAIGVRYQDGKLRGVDCGSKGINERDLTWMLPRNPIFVTLKQDVVQPEAPKFAPVKPAEMLDAVIDISHHQTLTASAFNEMKRAGILAVIHKATQGGGYVDPDYAPRKKRAESIGLLFGAYHFADSTPPKAQAEHLLRNAQGAKWLCLDWEDNPSGGTMTLAGAEAFVIHIHAKK